MNRPEKAKTIAVSEIPIPEDSSAEISAIGALICGAWRDHIGTIHEDWFNNPANLDVLRAINRLVADGVQVGIEPLFRELKQNAATLKDNWLAYLDDCVDAAASSSMFPYYRDKLIEKANARHWHKLALDVLGEIASGASPEEFEGSLSCSLTRVLSKDTAKSAKPEPERIEECFNEIVELANGTRSKQGLSLGFPKMDAIIQGWKGGSVNIIGGRPGDGKSCLAGQILSNMVLQGIPVGMFSLEMHFEEFVRRGFANLANLSMSNIHNGNLNNQEIARLKEVKDQLKAGSLFIEDSPKTIPQMRAKARLWVEYNAVKCIFLDYVQLAKMGGRYPSRYEELCEVSLNIKQMAMELNVPVIILSQFNRDGSKDRPALHNLKDCGQLEQDASSVLLLYRPEGESDDYNIKQIIACIDKNRNGPTGDVALDFSGRYQRFTERGTPTI